MGLSIRQLIYSYIKFWLGPVLEEVTKIRAEISKTETKKILEMTNRTKLFVIDKQNKHLHRLTVKKREDSSK